MRFLVLAQIAACAPQSPIARLADFPEPRIAGTEVGFNLDYDVNVDCFELSSDVHGVVDGRPLTVSARGGSRDIVGPDACDGISFRFPPLADRAVTSIELFDDDTTWSFEVTRLAPARWTMTAPDVVREGQDVVVTVTPADAEVEFVYIAPDQVGLSPFVAKPDEANTVHIDADYWSITDASLRGTSLAGTIAVSIVVVVTGCEELVNCSFRTHPPETPVTIVIP